MQDQIDFDDHRSVKETIKNPLLLEGMEHEE
jgi:hypothetical protein